MKADQTNFGNAVDHYFVKFYEIQMKTRFKTVHVTFCARNEIC